MQKDKDQVSPQIQVLISDPKRQQDTVVIQCNIKNIEAAGGDELSAQDIFFKLQSLLENADTQIIKVDVQDKFTSEVIVEENEMVSNAIYFVPFLQELLGINENPQSLYDGQIPDEQPNDDYLISDKFLQIKEILQLIVELHLNIDPLKNKELVDKITLRIRDQTFPVNKQIKVQLQTSVNKIKKMNSQQFTLIQGKLPLYINMAHAQELPAIEFNAKLGKRYLKISTFSCGIFTQPNQELNFNYHKYFDYDAIKNSSDKMMISPQLYYHSENSILQRKLDVIINIQGFFYLKSEIDLSLVSYVYEVREGGFSHLYFKLLSPPALHASFGGKNKHERLETKSDWVRVDNIFINSLYDRKIITEVQRLIFINQTVYMIKFDLQNDALQTLAYEQFIQILRSFRLMQSEKIAITQQQVIPTDATACYMRQNYSINFNILACISQNKFSDLKIIFDLAKELNSKQYKYHESAFQSFIKIANNVNSVNMFRTNQTNFKVLANKLKQSETEMVDLLDDIRIAFVRRISMTPSGPLFFSKMPEETSAVIRLYHKSMDHFIRVHFEDENQEGVLRIPYVTKCFYYNKIMPLEVLGKQYELLTWSASQLRTGSCWFLDTQSAKLSRKQFINSIGNFQNLNPLEIAKNAARLGQNLSSSQQITFHKNLSTNPLTLKLLKDEIDQNGKLYTDGIGTISLNLIEQIRDKYRNPDICAVQIRYEGTKGVLSLNTELRDNTIQLRPSMTKFEPNNGYGKSIEILDYNKFRGGYLNRQIITLLKTLNLEDQVFQDLQDEYLKKIEDISIKDASIYLYFNVEYEAQMHGIPSIIPILRTLINHGQDQTNNIFIDGVISRLKQRGLLTLRTKTNILVEKAARVIGLVDEFKDLQPNQVYCSVEKQTVLGKVMVTRNPCLHPGDIRVLEAVPLSKNYLEFTNCIIFPQQGDSIPPQIAGGDLDGDIYFVTWDQRLIPNETAAAMKYDLQIKKEKQNFKEMNSLYHQRDIENSFKKEKMIQFLFDYMNSDVLGKIDNSHLALADQSPQLANDPQCLELAELHSEAVDYVKHGKPIFVDQKLIAKKWPDFMEKESKLVSYESQNIIGKLYRQVVQICKTKLDNSAIWIRGYENHSLPELQTQFIYKYSELPQGDVPDYQKSQDQVINIREDIQQFIVDNFVPHIDLVLKCIAHIFENIYGIMKLYEIKNEYEIYSGNFTNFTKGDGLYFKRRLNVENVQKKVIQLLVVLKHDIQKILNLDKDQANKISLIYLILSYSPKTHLYAQQSTLGGLLAILINKLDQSPDWLKLKKQFTVWYRGSLWYFFYDELIKLSEQANPQNDLI